MVIGGAAQIVNMNASSGDPTASLIGYLIGIIIVGTYYIYTKIKDLLNKKTKGD